MRAVRLAAVLLFLFFVVLNVGVYVWRVVQRRRQR